MTYLIEQLINGICQGAIYALFAIGYTIIVGGGLGDLHLW